MFLSNLILGLNFISIYSCNCKVIKESILFFFLSQVVAYNKTKKGNLKAVKVKI
jgi:hypothetical protein